MKFLLFAIVGLSFIHTANGAVDPGTDIDWMGSAPSCPTVRRGQTLCTSSFGVPIMTDKRGDGARCATGRKTCCCFGAAGGVNDDERNWCSVQCAITKKGDTAVKTHYKWMSNIT